MSAHFSLKHRYLALVLLTIVSQGCGSVEGELGRPDSDPHIAPIDDQPQAPDDFLNEALSFGCHGNVTAQTGIFERSANGIVVGAWATNDSRRDYSWFDGSVYEQRNGRPWTAVELKTANNEAPAGSVEPNGGTRMAKATIQPQWQNVSVYSHVYDACTQKFRTENLLILNFGRSRQQNILYHDGKRVNSIRNLPNQISTQDNRPEYESAISEIIESSPKYEKLLQLKRALVGDTNDFSRLAGFILTYKNGFYEWFPRLGINASQALLTYLSLEGHPQRDVLLDYMVESALFVGNNAPALNFSLLPEPSFNETVSGLAQARLSDFTDVFQATRGFSADKLSELETGFATIQARDPYFADQIRGIVSEHGRIVLHQIGDQFGIFPIRGVERWSVGVENADSVYLGPNGDFVGFRLIDTFYHELAHAVMAYELGVTDMESFGEVNADGLSTQEQATVHRTDRVMRTPDRVPLRQNYYTAASRAILNERGAVELKDWFGNRPAEFQGLSHEQVMTLDLAVQITMPMVFDLGGGSTLTVAPIADFGFLDPVSLFNSVGIGAAPGFDSFHFTLNDGFISGSGLGD